MTTKLIITSIAILSSMTVGIVALTQVYKSNTKVAMVSSSSSVLSSQRSLVSSSAVVQFSSVVVDVESTTPKPVQAVETPPKVAESKKPEVVKPVVTASIVPPVVEKGCDIKEDSNIKKVKGTDLCISYMNFEPYFDGVNNFYMPELDNSIVLDYYQTLMKTQPLQNKRVNIRYVKSNNPENDFTYNLTLHDFNRYMKEHPNSNEQLGPLPYYEATYKATKDANNKWSYKLVSIAEK